MKRGLQPQFRRPFDPFFMVCMCSSCAGCAATLSLLRVQVMLSSSVHLGDAALLVILEECGRMHHYNTMELHWRDGLQCPTEAEYISMVDGKTGSGFRVVTRLLLAKAAPDHSSQLAQCLLQFTDEVASALRFSLIASVSSVV